MGFTPVRSTLQTHMWQQGNDINKRLLSEIKKSFIQFMGHNLAIIKCSEVPIISTLL